MFVIPSKSGKTKDELVKYQIRPTTTPHPPSPPNRNTRDPTNPSPIFNHGSNLPPGTAILCTKIPADESLLCVMRFLRSGSFYFLFFYITPLTISFRTNLPLFPTPRSHPNFSFLIRFTTLERFPLFPKTLANPSRALRSHPQFP